MSTLLDFLTDNAGMIGLITFFTFFVLLLLWVFRPGTSEQFRQFGQIPLREHLSPASSETLETSHE